MKAVKFFVDLDELMSTSGRYDGKPKQSRSQICSMLRDIFNFTETERSKLYIAGSATIICSPESFCKFLIARREAGHVNQVRRLRIELIDYPMDHGPLTLVERLEQVSPSMKYY